MLWMEWFSAIFEVLIWSLDKHAPDWRTHQESKVKQTYYFKKRIVYETLKAIDAVEDESLGKKVKGRNVIEEAIARHGTISRYFGTLREPRGDGKT